MRTVTITQYRIACWLVLACFAAIFLPRFGVISFSRGVSAARTWRFFGHLIPVWAIRAYVLGWYLAAITGVIGSLLFWRPSRWILAIALISVPLIRPFLGLSVSSAYEAFVGTVGGIALIWITTVAFWSSVAEKYSKRPT